MHSYNVVVMTVAEVLLRQNDSANIYMSWYLCKKLLVKYSVYKIDRFIILFCNIMGGTN